MAKFKVVVNADWEEKHMDEGITAEIVRMRVARDNGSLLLKNITVTKVVTNRKYLATLISGDRVTVITSDFAKAHAIISKSYALDIESIVDIGEEEQYV
jgi:hypothetical protein